MRIVHERPPMWEEIAATFDVRGKPVVFAWGDRVFVPQGGDLHPSLLAHEAAHGARQGADETSIRRWWTRYLADPTFRLDEEIIGHKAELGWLNAHSSGRNDRRRYLAIVATKLAAPLYGGLISVAKAKEILRHG